MRRRVALVHRTVYHYQRAVQLGPQWLRLRPLPDPRAPAPEYRLTLDPPPLTLHWVVDPLGNQVARFALPGPVARLSIEVALELDMTPRNAFDFVLDAGAVRWPFAYTAHDTAALLPYLAGGAAHAGPALAAMRAETAADEDTVALLRGLAARVQARVDYIVRMEEGVWPPERTLAEGRGSCRDSAWLLVLLLRMHGIAARFVSGYLVQLKADGTPQVVQDGPVRDGAELHAWAEAYLPGAGWIGIDATSGAMAAEGHVALAAGPEPMGAAPLTGTMEPAESRLETSIDVSRLDP